MSRQSRVQMSGSTGAYKSLRPSAAPVLPKEVIVTIQPFCSFARAAGFFVSSVLYLSVLQGLKWRSARSLLLPKRRLHPGVRSPVLSLYQFFLMVSLLGFQAVWIHLPWRLCLGMGSHPLSWCLAQIQTHLLAAQSVFFIHVRRFKLRPHDFQARKS